MNLAPVLTEIQQHQRPYAVVAGGQLQPDLLPPALIFPGSFHPLHYGHLRLSYAATVLSGLPVCFELSIVNVDKGTPAIDDVLERLAQFPPHSRIILTSAPLFLEKSHLLAGRTFVLGYDTAQRLIDQRYYGSLLRRDAALAEFRRSRTSFLIAGRHSAGRFSTLSDLDIPAEFRSMFSAVPASLFAADISSSALRAATAQNRGQHGAML